MRSKQRLSHTSEEIHARQIVVASEQDAAAIQKLLATGASFDALAMQRSTDAATRFNGGDLGYFTLDAMPEAYGAALKTAKIGETVGPFKTDGGFTLLRVEDRRPEKPISIEEARPQIVRFLTYDENSHPPEQAAQRHPCADADLRLARHWRARTRLRAAGILPERRARTD